MVKDCGAVFQHIGSVPFLGFQEAKRSFVISGSSTGLRNVLTRLQRATHGHFPAGVVSLISRVSGRQKSQRGSIDDPADEVRSLALSGIAHPLPDSRLYVSVPRPPFLSRRAPA